MERVDLHTHSRHSDGALSPTELVERAALRGVQLLSLTDHDSVNGCETAQRACAQHGIRFVPGIELTTCWREREVHVVGLAIDPSDGELQRHCQGLIALRRTRIEAMAARLSSQRLPGDALAREVLSVEVPTRTHLAQQLLERGLASSLQQAFDRYLARGRPGYVKADWPALDATVNAITGAGGLAVLAHPHRYKMSQGVLREMVAQFKVAGGRGIEVSLAGMGPGDADRAAALARRFELMGSIGSDFHQPDLPWRPLGRFAKLPDRIVPVMMGLAA